MCFTRRITCSRRRSGWSAADERPTRNGLLVSITEVSPELAEAVARAIYETLLPSRKWDQAKPEIQARYREAAREAVVTARFAGGIPLKPLREP
jgi:hypothetical protein